MEIELQSGAILKLADGESTLESVAEITTDHGAPQKLDDLSVGGEYDLGLKATIYTIMIGGLVKDINAFWYMDAPRISKSRKSR